jgi:hypothetical protein
LNKIGKKSHKIHDADTGSGPTKTTRIRNTACMDIVGNKLGPGTLWMILVLRLFLKAKTVLKAEN